MQDADRVCILLGVKDGAGELPQQLESYAHQTHRAWDLIASDDGSRDASAALLGGFARQMRAAGCRVTVVEGPTEGFAANYLSLIGRAPDDAAWLACSDQDDVWLPDRLARGIAALSALPDATPALYCSRTWITDATLGSRRPSLRFRRPPSFRNALVQNIAPGNTILLNRAAAALARAAAPRAAAASPGLVSHDWWLYQLIVGAGGTVVLDPSPTLFYRQHAANLVGANDDWRARRKRIVQLLQGRFRDWNDANILALAASADLLTAENRAVLERFAAARRRALLPRLAGLYRLGLYRQGRAGQVALWIAAALGRL